MRIVNKFSKAFNEPDFATLRALFDAFDCSHPNSNTQDLCSSVSVDVRKKAFDAALKDAS